MGATLEKWVPPYLFTYFFLTGISCVPNFSRYLLICIELPLDPTIERELLEHSISNPVPLILAFFNEKTVFLPVAICLNSFH